MYRIVDWGEHFENNQTRNLKEMRWVRVPNQMGAGYVELMDADPSASYLGCWLALIEIASTCEPRGTLSRKGKALSATQIAKIGHITTSVMEAALAKFLEMQWVEEVQSETQQGAFETQSPNTPLLAYRNGMEGMEGRNGTEGTGSLLPIVTTPRKSSGKFDVDVERFKAEYPNEVSDWDVQILLSEIRAQADQDLLFRNLGLYQETEKWQNGFAPSAENFLRKGLWKVQPKSVSGALRAAQPAKEWRREDHL